MSRGAWLALLVAGAAACGVAACGSGDALPPDARDAGTDAATDPDAACFEDPQTHHEIINACTDAQKIYKVSNPPLLGPDGSLPPLP